MRELFENLIENDISIIHVAFVMGFIGVFLLMVGVFLLLAADGFEFLSLKIPARKNPRTYKFLSIVFIIFGFMIFGLYFLRDIDYISKKNNNVSKILKDKWNGKWEWHGESTRTHVLDSNISKYKKKKQPRTTDIVVTIKNSKAEGIITIETYDANNRIIKKDLTFSGDIEIDEQNPDFAAIIYRTSDKSFGTILGKLTNNNKKILVYYHLKSNIDDVSKIMVGGKFILKKINHPK